MLAKSGVKVIADIYGKTDDINYENKIKSYIERNGLSDIVQFKGHVDNVNKAISEYECFVYVFNK